MGVNSLPKTVTRQRRDCDLNPGRSAPESSTLTTRLPSHPVTSTEDIYWYSYWRLVYVYVHVSGGRCVAPPLVLNAVARLNVSARCVVVSCTTGHRFPDGLTAKTFYCRSDGSWDYDLLPHCDGT